MNLGRFDTGPNRNRVGSIWPVTGQTGGLVNPDRTSLQHGKSYHNSSSWCTTNLPFELVDMWQVGVFFKKMWISTQNIGKKLYIWQTRLCSSRFALMYFFSRFIFSNNWCNLSVMGNMLIDNGTHVDRQYKYFQEWIWVWISAILYVWKEKKIIA